MDIIKQALGLNDSQKEESQRVDHAYQAGEDYADDDTPDTGLLDDLKALGLNTQQDLDTLIAVIKSTGKPIDDRQMTMEKTMAVVAQLPKTSPTRRKLTGVIIDTLWSSLQHPPLSYLGDKYQYRTPDGSYNNPIFPDLGKAGMPYAKSVKKLKHLKGTPPDPGLLFDLLQARTPESFKENPAGVSSMLFYNATIIIHDIFRSNRFDNRISDTSSYLDLAPLYGSNLQDQLAVRTMSNGMLKPDTFSEMRLIGQPPGVNCILVMYSRFHNYVADILLKINEYGRFTLPPTTNDDDKAKALKKQDEDLFQTARLITNGMYVNIGLHDYLRGLTNVHHSNSDWILDPRVEADRMFDPEGVPKGCGNQVSAEFNLLYRFHPVISLRDEKWLTEFLTSLFPGLNKPLDQLTPQEFVMGLFRFENSVPADPSKREFGGIKRGPDGKFADADLVRILTESMEDPAGLFGARMVPKALKMIEVAGTLTARKWQLASLNELRAFFNLKQHQTFEEINPDPEIAGLLRKLYQDPDMVEMYPGMFIEDGKPRLDPGSGGCLPYTAGRAVFSDAISLVRSDRFLTLDYTTSTLTNWGMQEVQYDLRVLGGSMYYKLFQRALPNWFPYNSLHIMQPMYTRKMNEQIARELGNIDKYCMDGPSPPRPLVPVMDNPTIVGVLSDQTNFKVPWAKNLRDLFGGKKNLDTFMLAGDTAVYQAQKKLMVDKIYGKNTISKLLQDATYKYADAALKAKSVNLTPNLIQVDVLRDVGIPALTQVLCDLTSLDLKTTEYPNGSLDIATMYKHLMNFRVWSFEDTDIAMSWQRRMWAEDAYTILHDSTTKSVNMSLLGTRASSSNQNLRLFGQNMVKELAAAGKTVNEIVEIMWPIAVGGVGAVMALLAQVLGYFLKPENADMWAKIQSLANDDSDASTSTVRQYVVEAQRLTSAQRDVRICASDTTVSGQSFKAGDLVVLLLGPAGRNPKSLADPMTFKLDRPKTDYLSFGSGPHECLGKEIALCFTTTMIKELAGLKNLRPAPGDMGVLKTVNVGTEMLYLNDSWSYLTSDPSTWTMHFDGYGTGVHTTGTAPATTNVGNPLDSMFNSLKKEAAAVGSKEISLPKFW